MTIQEQDAIAGRVGREHREAVRRLATIEAELAKMGDMYRALGRALYRSLLIRFDDEPAVQNPPYGFVEGEFRFKTASIDGAKLGQLCADLRDAKSKEEELAEQKRRLEA
jgi:hypothetical protein